MKRIIIFFALVISSSMTAAEWKFTPFPKELPTDYENTLNHRRDFLVENTVLYKSKLIFAHPFDGFTMYAGKDWKFYTPKKIRELIENKEVLKELNLNNISVGSCAADINGNLWFQNYAAVFKYSENPEKIRLYHKFRLKSNKYILPFYVNHVYCFDGEVYARVFFTDDEDIHRGAYFLYDRVKDEFVEKIDAEPNNTTHRNNNMTIIGKDGIPYNSTNIVVTHWRISGSSGGNIPVHPDIIQISNDTLLTFYSKYIAKSVNGTCVEIDSTLLEYSRKYSGADSNQVKYNMAVKKVAFNNPNLYFYSFADQIVNTKKPKHILFVLNTKTYTIDTISVPIAAPQYENTFLFASEFIAKEDGSFLLIFNDVGIFQYDPHSTVVEDDNVLRNVVGVWVKNIFPNPTNDRCHIDFFLNRLHLENIKIEISDVNGKIYKDISKQIQYNHASQEASLDFSVADMPSGNYYVLFTTNKNKQMRGLLILK